MNEQIIQEIRMQINREREQAQRSREFVDMCRRENVPAEIVSATEACIRTQESTINTCEDVLKKILEEKEGQAE